MNYLGKLKQRCSRLLIVGMVCGLAGFVVGVIADDSKRAVVTPFQDAKFVPLGPAPHIVPLDPAQPDAAQMAVLWGDPATGPSAVLLKMKKAGGLLHTHTSDYHLVVIQGTMKHWSKGEQEADARPLGPGSYWFRPGNQAHADSCLTDECLMFLKWEGKRDAKLDEAPKK